MFYIIVQKENLNDEFVLKCMCIMKIYGKVVIKDFVVLVKNFNIFNYN